MDRNQQLHLGAFMRPVSIHTAWWRYPGTFTLLAGEFSKLLLARARVWSATRWTEIRAWLEETVG